MNAFKIYSAARPLRLKNGIFLYFLIFLKFNHIKNGLLFNEGKPATSFCHQVAALVPDMFCNFYLVKNYKIANDTATSEAR
jgi:hypothetical protein